MERNNPPAKEMSRAKAAAATVKTRQQAAVQTPSRGLLPSGITMLNCALADNSKAGIPAGKIINLVGDSSAGKTLLAETCLAAIANDPDFQEYQLILDDAEHALEMNMEYLFGKKASKRIKAPRYDKDGLPLNSDTVEQFFANVMGLIKAGQPFVYFLDSLDSLTDSAEYEQAESLVKAAEKSGDEELADLSMPGSYGMAKAKLMSQVLRTIKAGISDTASVVAIISQVRDNINARPGQATKRRAGGKALEFYCSATAWLARTKTITKDVKGAKKKPETIGAEVEVKITKNKITGKLRTVEYSQYYDYGIDNTSSMLDFLVERGTLKKAGAYVDAKALGYDQKMYMADLVAAVEEDEITDVVVDLVQAAWDEKEDALRLNRKPRFK